MIPTQMLKGVLDGCLLKIISVQETYGYEITQKLFDHGFGKITEGTIYPILLRMQQQGLIEAAYKESELGPKRKYYHITDFGRFELNKFMTDIENLNHAVNSVLSLESEEENE